MAYRCSQVHEGEEFVQYVNHAGEVVSYQETLDQQQILLVAHDEVSQEHDNVGCEEGELHVRAGFLQHCKFTLMRTCKAFLNSTYVSPRSLL